MILKALYDYYNRSGDLAPAGFENKEIHFIIVIDEKGQLINIEDRRIDKKKSQTFLVIKCSHTNAVTPLIWYDNLMYALNYIEPLFEKDQQDPEKVKKQETAIEKANTKHLAFVAKCNALAKKYPSCKVFNAVTLFYKNDGIEQVKESPIWSEMTKKAGANVSFLLNGDKTIAACIPELINEIKKEPSSIDESMPYCLITGERTNPVRTATDTPILDSKNSAKLVSFNNDAFLSYGKKQCANAPMSPSAESAFSTAIKTMSGKDSHNKFLIGSRTFLFWASSDNEASQKAEEGLYNLLGYVEDESDDPNRRIEQVRKVFNSIYSGVLPTSSDDKFYFLGLAPNAARIAVVYWNESTLKDFAKRISDHFSDMDIVDSRKDKKPYYGLRQIMSAIALQGKVSDVQPNLPEAVIKSIVQGIPYPYSLISACMKRIRAEQDVRQDVRITRAAIIKAYLNRINDNHQKIKVMIDKENTNQGYLCGRLFATLEYLQERSSNGLNSIRGRYMNAASATPAAVFATILNLSVHHAEKLEKGGQIFFEQLKSEIIDKIPATGFPAHLSLQDQGRFMVGYYQQRQEFYTKKEKTEENNVEQ
jgi:CRISPR-associated protein Csd1